MQPSLLTILYFGPRFCFKVRNYDSEDILEYLDRLLENGKINTSNPRDLMFYNKENNRCYKYKYSQHTLEYSIEESVIIF